MSEWEAVNILSIQFVSVILTKQRNPCSVVLSITGVGCSKSYVDNWIAHQDDFNALLANLGQDHKLNEEASDSSSKVTSLEHNSKTSKGRLQ